YKGQCKYQDCLHINETDCAIKAHLGEIDETRYESYIAFVEEAKEYKQKVTYQGKKQESSHKTLQDKVAVKISARKRESARNTQKQNVYRDLDDERFN
ncbi:hypothetical protein IKB17_01760, partial [bacterium]|nr:hypothetical protein [bacterium]